MDSITINIAGDLFLGRGIEQMAEENPTSLFDEKILRVFQDSDFNIVNLEGPVTNAGTEHQILKTGPHMKAVPETFGALRVLDVHLVTLANNHIYDYGDKGLADTLDICQSNKIETVGAGLDFKKASEVFYKEIKGILIAVVNITENEWSVANEDHGGANPMNMVANTRTLHEVKKKADIVILIVHGGHERYHFPSPRIVDQFHFYAEEGASIIIGHHSHCISGYEDYNGVPIFYGLGNFLFHIKTDFPGWFEGILLNLQINQIKEISWKLHPYKQCKEGIKVELLEGQAKQKVKNELIAINEIIADPIKLKKEYGKLINRQKHQVLSMLSTSQFWKSKTIRSIIRKLKFEKFFIRRNQLKLILNSSRCESLKEVTNEVVENYLKTR